MKPSEKKTGVSLVLQLVILTVFSMAASFAVCTAVNHFSPPAPAPGATVNRAVLKQNYRLIKRIQASLADLSNSRDTRDLRQSPPQEKFSRCFWVLSRIRQTAGSKKNSNLPGLLRMIHCRDSYFRQQKNYFTYIWLMDHASPEQVASRVKLDPDFPKSLRLRILPILLKTGSKDKFFPMFRTLFLHESFRRLKKSLPAGDFKYFLKKIRYPDWENKFRTLGDSNKYAEISRFARYCPHRELKIYFRARQEYHRHRYTRSRKYLKQVTLKRLQPLCEALRIKIDIRENSIRTSPFARIDRLRSHKDIYRELLYNVGGIFLVRNRLKLALQSYSRFTKSSSVNDSRHWKSIWVRAWIQLKLGRNRSACRLFRKGMKSPVPGYKIASSYWANRCRNTSLSVIAEYPYTFYFARHFDFSHPGLDHGLRRFSEKLSKPLTPAALELAEKLITAINNGFSRHLPDYLQQEIGNGKYKKNDRNFLCLVTSLIYEANGDHFRSFVNFRTRFPDFHTFRIPAFLSHIAFPLEYSELILPYAAERKLDPFLVMALIREESLYRHDIRSRSNAYGLMQMLPRTYAHLSGKKLNRRLKWDLIDPETNIKFGTLYLRKLLKKYRGEVHLALAAYNAGDHRVDRWLKQFGSAEHNKFIEMIPFTETRNYVKNILRNHFYYRFYYSDMAN